MGQSLSAIYVHAVFGTKFRKPLIAESIETELHAYIAGILKNLDSPAIKINSVPDHIHILFRLSKNYTIAKVMEHVKKDSSKWMKTKGVIDFKWQIGYGAFSVSASGIKNVSNYIANQKQHHGKVAFEDEVGRLMKDYNVSQYAEEYFWS